MAVESSVVVSGETVDQCSNGQHIQKLVLYLAMLLVLCVASTYIFGNFFGLLLLFQFNIFTSTLLLGKFSELKIASLIDPNSLLSWPTVPRSNWNTKPPCSS